jgi:hypothetical protein
MLDELLAQLRGALEALNLIRMTDEHRLKLYEAAVVSLGKDASPKDRAPDELGCAETFFEIERKAFPGSTFKPENILSTYSLRKALRESPLFKQVYIAAPGDVIISPTGYASKKRSDGSLVIPNGHVGIVMLNGKVASNDSRDGIFRQNYTIGSWHTRYSIKGGYPVEYFRRIAA